MFKTKLGKALLSLALALVLALGLAFVVAPAKVSAASDGWVADTTYGNFKATENEGEYATDAYASHTLSTIAYTGSYTDRPINSVSADVYYTDTTTAGDEWVGFRVTDNGNQYYFQFTLNAPYGTQYLPYMSVYLGSGCLYSNENSGRVARELFPLNTYTNLKITFNEENIKVYAGDTLILDCKDENTSFSFTNITEILFCTRDVKMSVKNLTVEKEPIKGWIPMGGFTATENAGEYSLAASGSSSVLTYYGDYSSFGAVTADFYYTSTTIAGDHWLGFNVDGFTFQMFLNAPYGEQYLPYMSVYQPGWSAPSWTNDGNRIPRTDMPLNAYNTLKLAFDESTDTKNLVNVYVNGKLVLSCEGIVFNTIGSIAFQTRDVEMKVKNLNKITNMASLKKAITAAEALTESDYTPASWTTFAQGLATAKAFVEGATSSTTAEQVTAAESALATAKSALKAAADFTAYNAAVEATSSLKEENYTATSWTALTAALTAGEALTANSAQTEVDAAATAIENAHKALVSVAELKAAIATAEAYTETGYTPASWETFATALAAAKNASDEATQSDIDALTAALTAATEGLTNVADFTAYTAAVDAAEALDEENYTTGSWEALTAALAAGEALTANSAQTEVDAATTAITEATAALVDVSVLKTTVFAAMEAQQEMNEREYTPVSWKAFDDAIADGALTSSTATQDEVDAKVKAITDTQAALVSVKALAVAIETADAYEEENYTEESWAAFAAALTAAKGVASDATQEQVDALTADLNGAMEALTEKPAQPEDPETSATTSEITSEADSEEETTSSSKKKVGCSGVIGAGAAIMGIVTVLGALVFVRKKEND